MGFSGNQPESAAAAYATAHQTVDPPLIPFFPFFASMRGSKCPSSTFQHPPSPQPPLAFTRWGNWKQIVCGTLDGTVIVSGKVSELEQETAEEQ